MVKKETGIFEIISESVGLYFSNFSKFFKYMSFPVLGQIIGLILIFSCTYVYTKNLPYLISNYKFFDNFFVIIFLSLLITLPGFIILLKAFWEFIVAYGAVNSMVESMTKSGKLYDFPAHNQVITRRANSYILLWFIYGLFILLSLNICFWVLGLIFFIYFILIFQIFTLEELPPLQCFKRSLELIKGNYLKTALLVLFIGGFTYLLLPQLIMALINLTNTVGFLSNYLQVLTAQFPLDVINSNIEKIGFATITPYSVASTLISLIITQVIIQYTLPLRTICWCLWYKKLNKNKGKIEKKKQKKTETAE